jgi:tetratricopeptide (TPR) repeat protein
MIRQLKITAIATIILAQLSCAPAGYQKTEIEAGAEQSSVLAMATQAWQQTSTTALPAVDDLIMQADAQIAMSNWDVASEKLERALRISPDYAPAWSRMSQIALLKQDPSRAIQMAKRSNSHAGKSAELKLLNWQFIREASEMQGDAEGVQNASKAIYILQGL